MHRLQILCRRTGKLHKNMHRPKFLVKFHKQKTNKQTTTNIIFPFLRRTKKNNKQTNKQTKTNKTNKKTCTVFKFFAVGPENYTKTKKLFSSSPNYLAPQK